MRQRSHVVKLAGTPANGRKKSYRRGRALVSAATTAAIGLFGSVMAPGAQAAEAQGSSTEGCSYGTGGPKVDALCWIDLGSFGNVAEAEMPQDKNLTLTVGRYEVSMVAEVTKGDNGANGVAASAFPTWGAHGASQGSLLGGQWNGEDYYVGVDGHPAFYQLNNGTDGTNLARDTVTLKNITVTDTKTNEPVNSGFALVLADAESTGNGEGFSWTSDKTLSVYQKVVPTGWSEPCAGGLDGEGTSTLDCTGGVGIQGNRGILMASADAPTTISSTFRNNGGSSRQGIAFAMVFSTVNAKTNVVQGGGSDAEFTITSTVGGDPTPVGTVPNDGGEKETGLQQFLSGAEESETTFTVRKTAGNTPIEGYEVKWSCTVNGSTAAPILSDGGLTATVETAANGTSTCEATITAKPPVTGDKAVTINPNEVATLTPEATPGTGEITKVAFDNGETPKVVEGEGAWTIELKDGQPVATFTPEEDYTGKVTQQPYTLTDVNGLSASGKLDVTIVTEPTPTPTPTPTPSETPTQPGSPSATPSTTVKSSHLPKTGAEYVVPFGLGAFALVLLGGAATFAARSRRHGRG